jgi:hypothetical protein
MSTTSTDWRETLGRLFDEGVRRYESGRKDARAMFDATETEFLATIGYTAQELFDFAEDFSKAGAPSRETALELAAIRRDYFLQEQKGVASSRRISMADLPSKDAEIDGIGWLPRLIPKAEAKLRGEMPPDLMYGCGGDRKFFREHGIDPADFLREVWAAQGDRGRILAWVKNQSKLAPAK